MFKAKTIRSGENLGVIDIAIRRPDFRQHPSELTSVHIENKDAVVSTGVIGIWNTFNEQFRIKNCLLAAIEYDGTWSMTVDEKYVFYTIGEPYIVYVNDKMELLIQQGQGTPTRLTSGNITSISCIRGWKNIHTKGIDQGFVVSYIKDGLAYYKAYYEDDTGNKVWCPETKLNELGDNLKNIRVHRSNDFRLIFTTTNKDNKATMCITDRCFGGFSVRGEYVCGQVHLPTVELKTVQTHTFYADSSTDLITGQVHLPTVSTFDNGEVKYISAYNEGLYIIKLFTDVELQVSNIVDLRRNLTFTDENNNRLYYKNVSKKPGYLLFDMLSMNDVIGDINVKYTSGSGALSNMAGTDLASFEMSFTPTDITGTVVSTPTIINSYNIDGCTIILEFNEAVFGTDDVIVDSFEISSIEEEYVYGPTFKQYYTPSSATVSGEMITLKFDADKSFNNAQADIVVEYNMGLGDLIDADGNRIKTQSTSFEPVNLIFKPNPNHIEMIPCSVFRPTTTVTHVTTHVGYGGTSTDIVTGKVYMPTVSITEVGEIRP